MPKFINYQLLKNIMIFGLFVFITSCGNKGPLEIPQSSFTNNYSSYQSANLNNLEN